MHFDSNGDGLNWRKPYEGDVVFFLQKSEMPFSSLKLKPRIEPDVTGASVLIKGVNEVKQNVRVRASRNGAYWV